jgi:phycobilisome core-membrane linker protein
MSLTFINPVIAPNANLGLSSFDDTSPVRLWQTFSEEDVEIVIRAVYRQVLGNAHVMESERLHVPESQLKQGDISVREFVRQVAQSDLYRARFFESCPRVRSIELNFKHLLGRAPESYEEMTEHGQILDQGGFQAEIDAYIDSDEYQESFGEDIVPYYRGYKTQMGKKMVGFTHLFQLLRGPASSDKDPTHQNRSRLNASLMKNRPSQIAPLTGASMPWEPVTHSFQPSPKPVRPVVQSVPFTVLASDLDRQAQFYQAYQPFKETAPVELNPGATTAEVDLVIRAVYRQVLGNAHVMESERLTIAESQLKLGILSVCDFVRVLAKSTLYRDRFFTACPRYRAIELNYKHLLGRAPDSFEEMRTHSTILDQQDFEADIDSYLDSDEYQTAFGENIVPYYRGYQTQAGQSMLGLTNFFQLLRSASSSDKNPATSNKPQLTRSLILNQPYGKQKVRDAQEILAEVFKTTRSQTEPAQSEVVASQQAADLALQQTIQAQSQIIAQLQQQFAELRPFATLGSAQIKNGWQSSASIAPADASASLNQQVDAQAAQIAQLQEQIADARRYAAIGEFRANKWRSRVFNG